MTFAKRCLILSQSTPKGLKKAENRIRLRKFLLT